MAVSVSLGRVDVGVSVIWAGDSCVKSPVVRLLQADKKSKKIRKRIFLRLNMMHLLITTIINPFKTGSFAPIVFVI